jgi:hypothetical protein
MDDHDAAFVNLDRRGPERRGADRWFRDPVESSGGREVHLYRSHQSGPVHSASGRRSSQPREGNGRWEN